MSATRYTLAGPTLRVPREADPQKIARLAGWLFIVTFVASIPAFFIFYKPVLDHPNYIVGAGADGRIALGAFLEMIVIVANIGSSGRARALPSATSPPASWNPCSSASASSVCSRS